MPQHYSFSGSQHALLSHCQHKHYPLLVFECRYLTKWCLLLIYTTANDSTFTDCRIIDQAHLSHVYLILRGSLANKLLYYMFTIFEYTNLHESLGGCVSLAQGLV